MAERRFDYHLGDIVRTKKAHPCGGDRWEVVRVGMDIRLKCLSCGHQMLLPRANVDKMVKTITAKVDQPDQ